MTGTGTVSDPYIIYDPDDLQDMSLDLTACYELACNIDATETAAWNAGAGFVPIGALGSSFTGTFDGKGYTISDLTIVRAATNYVGLFGYVSGGGGNIVIKNVTLADAAITGQDYVGVLVGYAPSIAGTTITISGCTVGGAVVGDDDVGGLCGHIAAPDVDSGTITDCRSSCTVTSDSGDTSDGNSFGGLVGEMSHTTIAECSASGAVLAKGYVGGLIGRAIGDTGTPYAVVKKSYATGNCTAGWMVGGLIGYATGVDIDDCFATGDTSASSANSYSGGLVGNAGYVDITNSFSIGAPTGTNYVGGFLGYSDANGVYSDCFWDTTTSGTATACGSGAITGVTGNVTADMQVIGTFSEANWDISRTWSMSASCNGGYPCLVYVNSCCPAGGMAPPADPTIAPKKVSLELIRNLEIMNGGRFFIDKSGNARWESRYHRG